MSSENVVVKMFVPSSFLQQNTRMHCSYKGLGLLFGGVSNIILRSEHGEPVDHLILSAMIVPPICTCLLTFCAPKQRSLQTCKRLDMTCMGEFEMGQSQGHIESGVHSPSCYQIKVVQSYINNIKYIS